MSSPAILMLGMGIGAAVVALAPVVTTVWYETHYLKRVAADFDPGPGLWLEKRGDR